jgi:hypothetical protein
MSLVLQWHLVGCTSFDFLSQLTGLVPESAAAGVFVVGCDAGHLSRLLLREGAGLLKATAGGELFWFRLGVPGRDLSPHPPWCAPPPRRHPAGPATAPAPLPAPVLNNACCRRRACKLLARGGAPPWPLEVSVSAQCVIFG